MANSEMSLKMLLEIAAQFSALPCWFCKGSLTRANYPKLFILCISLRLFSLLLKDLGFKGDNENASLYEICRIYLFTSLW